MMEQMQDGGGKEDSRELVAPDAQAMLKHSPGIAKALLKQCQTDAKTMPIRFLVGVFRLFLGL